MAKKILMLVASLACVGSAVAADPAAPTMMQRAKDIAGSTRDHVAYKSAMWAVLAGSLVWQAVVAHRDAQGRGIIEDVETKTDSFFTKKVFNQFVSNFTRGLTLRKKKVAGQEVMVGNKINTLASYAFLLSLIDRGADVFSKKTEAPVGPVAVGAPQPNELSQIPTNPVTGPSEGN